MNKSKNKNLMLIGRALPDLSSSYGLFEYNQAVALAKRGLNVTYCFVDGRSVKINRRIKSISLYRDGLKICGKVFPFGGLPQLIKWSIRGQMLEKLLSREIESGNKPDVVYAQFPLITLAPSFLELLQNEKIPLICLEHWSQVRKKTLNKNLSILLNKCVSQSIYYCCVSRDLAESVKSLTNCHCDKTPIVPNMVSADIFYPKKIDSQTRYNDKRFKFLAVGRLTSGKRFEILINAFADANIEETLLLIAGTGDNERKLKSLTRQRGVEDKVLFLGWKTSEEIADLFRKCDCYVSASDDETFCVPFVESWMCGTPCIGTDNNPLRELFINDAGLLFKSDSKSSLTQCLKDMCSRENKIDEMRISNMAKSLFSEDAVCDSLCSLFNKI